MIRLKWRICFSYLKQTCLTYKKNRNCNYVFSSVVFPEKGKGGFLISSIKTWNVKPWNWVKVMQSQMRSTCRGHWRPTDLSGQGSACGQRKTHIPSPSEGMPLEVWQSQSSLAVFVGYRCCLILLPPSLSRSFISRSSSLLALRKGISLKENVITISFCIVYHFRR